MNANSSKLTAVNVLKASLSYLADNALPATPLNYAKAYESATGEPVDLLSLVPSSVQESVRALLEFEATVDRAVSGAPLAGPDEKSLYAGLSPVELFAAAENFSRSRKEKGRYLLETIQGVVQAVDSALLSAGTALQRTKALQEEQANNSRQSPRVSNLKEALLVIDALQAQAESVSKGFQEVAEALKSNEELLRAMQSKLRAVESERDLAVDKALHDPLTGLLNRRGLERKMSESKAGSLLMVDLDDFKKINDVYGHAIGDAALRQFAGVVKANLRATDMAGRTGGEEFVLFFPEVPAAAAKAVGQRILQALAKLKIQGASTLRISFSGGISEVVADYPDGAAIQDAIAKADTQLYRAKKAGKARIEAR